MARLQLGVDITVEGARELQRVSQTLDGTGDELQDLADHLDKAADKARELGDRVDDAAGRLSFDRATSSAQRLEDSGEGLRNLVNGLGDVFSAATDESAGFGERLALAAGGMADIANGARNFVIPAIQGLASGALASATSVVSSIGSQIAAWATLGVQSLLHAAKVALAWVIALGPIALLAAAVIAVVALIILNWEHIVAFLQGVFENIGNALSGFAAFLGQVWQGIMDAITAALQTFVGVFEGIWNGIMDFLKGIVSGIAGIGKKIWTPIADGLGAAIKVIKGIWNAFVRFWNGIQINVPSVNLPIIGKVGGFSIGLPDLPFLAEGGIVSQPTLAVLGERGPEAVVPLDRAGAFSPTVNVTVQGDMRADERTLPGTILRTLYVAGLTG